MFEGVSEEIPEDLRAQRAEKHEGVSQENPKIRRNTERNIKETQIFQQINLPFQDYGPETEFPDTQGMKKAL